MTIDDVQMKAYKYYGITIKNSLHSTFCKAYYPIPSFYPIHLLTYLLKIEK